MSAAHTMDMTVRWNWRSSRMPQVQRAWCRERELLAHSSLAHTWIQVAEFLVYLRNHIESCTEERSKTRSLPWFLQTKASNRRTSISSRTRSLKPRSVAKVLCIPYHEHSPVFKTYYLTGRYHFGFFPWPRKDLGRHTGEMSLPTNRSLEGESSRCEAVMLGPIWLECRLRSWGSLQTKLTAADGIPSTSIMRRNFLVPSSISPDSRDLEENLGWLRILLKEWAVEDAMTCTKIGQPKDNPDRDSQSPIA